MNEADFLQRIKRFLPKREQALVMKAFRETAIAAQSAPVYGVSFDTRTHPGFIKVTRVILETTLMDDTETVRLDLIEHPLYADLARYVENNSTHDGVDSRQRLTRAAHDVQKSTGMDALLVPADAIAPGMYVAIGNREQIHRLLSVGKQGEST